MGLLAYAPGGGPFPSGTCPAASPRTGDSRPNMQTYRTPLDAFKAFNRWVSETAAASFHSTLTTSMKSSHCASGVVFRDTRLSRTMTQTCSWRGLVAHFVDLLLTAQVPK